MEESHFGHILALRGTRRDFLTIGGGLAGSILLGTLPAMRADASVRLAAYPFTLGVGSGDPTPTGVVLWTRLAPDPMNGGGMPNRRVAVRWEVARDERFRQVVSRGDVLATPELGHSVHVEVDGLDPDRVYWYRFVSGGQASPVGRTRTAPAPGADPDRLRFAFASCQHYEAGHFTAYRHMAEEDLDLVVHLGDYIYEGGVGEGRTRRHNSPEIVTLADYRNRYALYKSDPDLQRAHALFPFVVTWDDHEVDNDYAGNLDQDGSPAELFLQRRAAAYQAYYEHMPLRRTSMPRGPDLRLFRRVTYGALAEFSVIDTRQYRTRIPCDRRLRLYCAEAHDPAATILGAEQERWLLAGLGRSTARWNVLANQVPVAPVLRASGDLIAYNPDKWDGYVHSRERLLKFIRENRVSNPVVITGDIHHNWVAEIKTSTVDPYSSALGAEFVGTSITSGGDGADETPDGRKMLANNPHMPYYNDQRGYVRCTLSRDRWTSDFRVVPYVTRPGAPVHTDASFVVESGRPGVQKG